ncbi:protein Niban 1 [Salmo salar]|uniref:Protein Niban 1 n=1 Tax=Salmo salar TaxID=8030 RepID=A0ABM3CB90_SALSA|nr:protein Niban 1 [Salmo salar]|eukprot:XP_013978997.1 PREDICTED: protein Niban [Salmo salar]
MGISPSSLLDESKSNYIRGCAEAELKEFSPHYRRQYSVVFFSQVQDELEQQKEKIKQLLKQRGPPKAGEVLYEEQVLHFDYTRKWKERYMVVRANHCLECHDSFESFVKGVPPLHKLLPTGGTVLTTEEKYMAMVDQCFPVSETNNVKEEFAPPTSGMPGQFPVYLRLPYRRDYYFCFRQDARQDAFLSILSDCIRHQNQDFLKKKTVEVQAFLKAVHLYRQEKGRYDSWNMLIGSDVRVLANLVMEELLPSLEKDMLPHLKAKKTERKRVWFTTIEAAYILVQECLLEGLSVLKEECKMAACQQEVLIRSDMDLILHSRTYLEGKLRASVSEPAEKLFSEGVQPYLASILEELMGPISSGFQEARLLIDNQMDQLCQDFQEGGVTDKLKQALAKLSKPNLLSCYQRINSLHDQLHDLQERFGFSNISNLVHSTQIDLQQLIENAAYSFELLFYKAKENCTDNVGSAMEKSRHMVLKQYDYDSSTVRKRIFQEALVGITLPHIKKNLAPTCKTELQGLEQFIDADYSNFLHVENIYEGILLQTLDKEVSKVVKDAASLQKHNLFTDSRDPLSQTSRSSPLSIPSTPSSPARVPFSPTHLQTKPETSTFIQTQPETQPQAEVPAPAQPVSPDLSNSLAFVGGTQGDPPSVVLKAEQNKLEAVSGATVEIEALGASIAPAVTAPVEKLVKVENTVSIHETPVVAETKTEDMSEPTETAQVDTPVLTETEKTPTPGDGVEVEKTVVMGVLTTVAQSKAPSPNPFPVPDPSPVCVVKPVAVEDSPIAVEDSVAEHMASLTITTAETEAECESGPPNSEPEAASSGEQPVTAQPADASLAAAAETKDVPASSSAIPDDGDDGGVTESESAPSDIKIPGDDDATRAAAPTDEVKVSQSNEVEWSVSVTSNLAVEVSVSETPVGIATKPPVEVSEGNPDPPSDAPVSEATGGVNGEASVEVTAGAYSTVASAANLNVVPPQPQPDTQATLLAEPTKEALQAVEPAEPASRAMDCVKEIQDLVVAVFEVEEMVQRHPGSDNI